MAKTEAGEGMFGANLDMDSLTDSDDEPCGDLSDLDGDFKKKKVEFDIVGPDEGKSGATEKQ